MNNKVPIFLSLGVWASGMQVLAAPPATSTQASPQPSAPVLRFHSTPDAKALPPARTCLLGSDCLAMDSRPFETCQLGSKSCGDKLAEVLQVERPRIVIKPAPPWPRNSR